MKNSILTLLVLTTIASAQAANANRKPAGQFCGKLTKSGEGTTSQYPYMIGQTEVYGTAKNDVAIESKFAEYAGKNVCVSGTPDEGDFVVTSVKLQDTQNF